MNNLPESYCPKCGAIIPEDAPQKLCPKCVFSGLPKTSVTRSNRVKTSPPSVEEVVEHFPELEIIELIGVGGMGAVYKARQPKLDRFVALKILAHDLAEDPAFEERFNREARVLARLNHPNIVTVFDFGSNGPFCFLLMEYVEGVNLRQAMQAGRFTPTESLVLVQDVCSALKFAHEEGVLHRDIKPENILLDSRGRVKIADFGIAKLIGADDEDDYTLTMAGSSLGSPHYMAPEQIETPGDIDQRADIYSLGVVFYELLTRELPIGRFAPPSERSSMDPRIDEIVMRALEKDRKARFQNVGEVKTGVATITESELDAQKSTAGNQPSTVQVPPVQPPNSFNSPSFQDDSVSHPIQWDRALAFYLLTLIAVVLTDVLILAGELKDPDLNMLFSLVTLGFAIPSIVFCCMLHFRCWKAIPENFRSVSPERAVGFLFIPFFNFYWAFVTWPKLAESLVVWQKSLGRTKIINVYGLAVTYGVLFVLSLTLAFFTGLASLIAIADFAIFILLYGAITKTINGIREPSA
ncbi:MAG: protein kinase [Akkermansiaceae bacterium]